jgi:hypothetical protein
MTTSSKVEDINSLFYKFWDRNDTPDKFNNPNSCFYKNPKMFEDEPYILL